MKSLYGYHADQRVTVRLGNYVEARVIETALAVRPPTCQLRTSEPLGKIPQVRLFVREPQGLPFLQEAATLADLFSLIGLRGLGMLLDPGAPPLRRLEATRTPPAFYATGPAGRLGPCVCAAAAM